MSFQLTVIPKGLSRGLDIDSLCIFQTPPFSPPFRKFGGTIHKRSILPSPTTIFLLLFFQKDLVVPGMRNHSPYRGLFDRRCPNLTPPSSRSMDSGYSPPVVPPFRSPLLFGFFEDSLDLMLGPCWKKCTGREIPPTTLELSGFAFLIFVPPLDPFMSPTKF